MRFLKQLLAAVSLSLVAVAVSATPDNPQKGVDYRMLDKAQQTDSGNKVEVTEFFGYFCPHCNSLEPALADWVKKQGDKIVFKRVPVGFDPRMVPQQKLYYALEAMGRVDDLHPKVFQAIHVQGQPLRTDDAIVAFIVKQGVDKQNFLDVYNSFAVQSKVQRATQLQNAYQVDGVPLLTVDGRFQTSPSIVGASMGNRPEPVLQAATFQVMDWLVAQSAKQKQPAAAAPAPAKKSK